MTPNLVELWLSYAKDDLKSASVLLREGIYNMVCFHSQQAVEKILKSLIAHHHEEIPRTHNLVRLEGICEQLTGKKLEIDDEKLMFLNDVYIDSRYPADFGLLPGGQSTKEDASKAYDSANKIFIYLRKLLADLPAK